MTKIASQLAGAAAVIATVAAGLAYAQTTDKPSTAGTVYEGGVNNGSTYVRSNQLGNASEAERPVRTTPPATTAAGTDNYGSGSGGPTSSTSGSASDSPATSDMNSSTPRVAAGASQWNADGTRAARADRN